MTNTPAGDVRTASLPPAGHRALWSRGWARVYRALSCGSSNHWAVRGALLAVAACGATPSGEAPDIPLPLVHSLFDCRAATDPERHTDVPLSCMSDAQCDTSLVVGHRGAGGNFALYAPENSLSARANQAFAAK